MVEQRMKLDRKGKRESYAFSEDAVSVVQDFFQDIHNVLDLPGDLSDYEGNHPIVPVIRNRVVQAVGDLFSTPADDDNEGQGRKKSARQLLDDGEKEAGALEEEDGNRILKEHLYSTHREAIESALTTAYADDEVQSALAPLLKKLAEEGLIKTTGENFTAGDFVAAFWSVLDVGYSRNYLKELDTPSSKLEQEKVFSSFFGVVVKNVFAVNKDSLPNMRIIYNGIIHTYNKDLDEQFPEVKKHRELMITRSVMQQTRDRVAGMENRLGFFLSQFDVKYLQEHGRALANMYFGVEKINITDSELVKILRSQDTDFVEYFCPPWQWKPEDRDTSKPLTNFAIEGAEPERRKFRVNNLADFLNLTTGEVTLLPADVQIPVVWREADRSRHTGNIESHLADVKTKLDQAGVSVPVESALLTAWLEAKDKAVFDKNYANLASALALIYEDAADLGSLKIKMSELIPAEYFDQALGPDVEEMQVFTKWLTSCSVSRKWLDRVIQNEYETKVKFTNIEQPDAVSYTIREIAMEIATYLAFADRKRVVLEEYDSLGVSSPYTLLSTRMSKELQLVVIPRTRSMAENAQLRITKEIENGWTQKSVSVTPVSN